MVQELGAGHDVQSIVNALAAGRFYASTGVVIRTIRSDELRVRVETENADRIIAYKDHGARFADASGNAIEARLPDDASYMRFECHGSMRSFAWTQPFFRDV